MARKRGRKGKKTREIDGRNRKKGQETIEEGTGDNDETDGREEEIERDRDK